MNTSRETDFACTSCGLCCKVIGEVLEMAKTKDPNNELVRAYLDFPYRANKDGSCEKLGEDGKCTVYENRPLVCNISGMFKKFWSIGLTRKEHYLVEAKSCNSLIRENGLPDKFLVDESQYQ